jgi:glucose/arabinose dehydrogenase
MLHTLWIATALLTSQPADGKTLATGLKNPASVAAGPDGKIYISTTGDLAKNGDGAILVLKDGKAITFAAGLDDPKGIAGYQKWLFVADNQRVWRIDLKGNKEVFAAPTAFPSPPMFLNDLVVDPESGTLYVSESGNYEGKGGAIHRIDPKGKVSLVTSAKAWPELHTPGTLAMDGQHHLLVGDFGTGKLHRLNVVTKKAEQIAEGFGAAHGLAWDMHGRLFISDWRNGQIFVINRPGEAAERIPVALESAADICLGPDRKTILIVDMKAGTLRSIPAAAPQFPVDETPLPLETAVAFPDLKWTGWQGFTDAGKVVPLRPILLTHAGDGTNRVFVPTQQGVIHVFPNDQKAKQTQIFLDLQKQVRYNDNENEEGFLGLAFHPRYKKTGEFFVFYTLKSEKLVNVVSRFRVRKDDPNRADPASEEVLLKIKRPFWNHDGGTLCFGPDGYLYIAIGDGGAANDPKNNAQDLSTILGDVLRIDVNKKDPGKNYAIPPDNPFVTKRTDVRQAPDKEPRPEIWAYGLRNVWRMAFDKKTGKLWAGEVGQNLYEEINIIEKGGNYGWKLRESLHPFFPQGVGPRQDLIEPIWEYHHDIGKSITGGNVYRGKKLPELDGHYLYADYVTGRIWALRYDEKEKRVVANRPIRDKSLPIMSFGEDEEGETYLMTYSAAGRGIYQFVRTK